MEFLALFGILVVLGGYGFLFFKGFQKATDLMLSVIEKTAVAVAHPTPRKELEQQMSESIAAFADMNATERDEALGMVYDNQGRIRDEVP